VNTATASASAALRQRADDLLGQLTLAEKIAMLHQWSPGVPRLGIAPFRTGTEALHGAAWLGAATVFPQAVGMGAMWDPDLVTAIGTAVGEEVRALHRRDPSVSLNVWAPVVNLLRDPRWGRNEEGYSEDPLLTARTAVAYCRGLRGDHPVYLRTSPLLKHFLGYNNETDRSTTSSVLRPRVLHEYDLPPFFAPVAAGVAVGVMPGYNLVNGRPNHVSPYLESELRRWADDELVVCSDAQAPSNLVDEEHYFADHPAAHAAALRAGVDSFTDHGEDPSITAGRFTEALGRGLIAEADVDRAVRRLLLLRLRLGEFDPGLDPYAAIGEEALGSRAHAELARRAARQAIVLLKNDAGVLPLTPRPDRPDGAGLRIAVIGPLADTLYEDWYSGTMPYRVTVAGGLTDVVRAAGGEVTCTEGADRVALRAESAPGLDLGEFDVFDWGDSVITLRSVANGLLVTVRDDGSLVADQTRPNGWVVHETFRLERQTGDPADSTGVLRSTATGRYVAIDERTGAMTASAVSPRDAARLRLNVVTSGIEQARLAASDADVAVVVVGNDPLVNGRETQDRGTLALPETQQRLVQAVHGAAPVTVLVVMSSYPYAITWADENVPAILWTCHGGQETGRGIADVLFGAHAPCGRLPQTWYRADDDLPGLLDYDIIKARRTYLYLDRPPLYPFGHGLAYTTFSYPRIRLDSDVARAADTVGVEVDVTNTGARDGVEVVQLYTRAISPARERPLRELRDFARIAVPAGETRTVRFPLPVASLACWDVVTHQMTAFPGEYDVMAGSSSEAIRQSARLTVLGTQPAPRWAVGTEVAAADFDDYSGVTLVDATPAAGDAVTPAGDAPGWILFRDTGLAPDDDHEAEREWYVTIRVARAEPGTARVELRRDHPVAGDLLSEFIVPSTGDKYAQTEMTADLARAPGVFDLYVVLHGALRLASFRVHAPAGSAPRGPLRR